MELIHDDPGVTRICAAAYTLETVANRPFVLLKDGQGSQVAELFALSDVSTSGGREDHTSWGLWQVNPAADGALELCLTAGSSLWQHKTVRFLCWEDHIRYEIEVTGRGSIEEIHYFGGHFSGITRWGSGFFWSGQSFRQGFSPEPNSAERLYFAPSSGASVDLLGVPVPGRADWFFTPPPFCFALQSASGWIGAGIAAVPGQNQYTALHYRGRDGAFYLSLDCEGHLPVDGRAVLPALTIDFADDEYAALARHAEGLRAAGLAPRVPAGPRPDWWQGPIFCGWGAQCALAARAKGRAPNYSRQENYERFLANLSAHGLQPPVVVIDDKWQLHYGSNQADPQKWPDLPGFIAARHAAGQKVLLWLKAWDPEGLPAEECITNAGGLPLAFDPTAPAFRARLVASVQTMLSDAKGYGADGFKLDFSARIPSGPGLRHHGPEWGLELMRAYLDLLYRAAKAAKPDALVIAHTPHPYLADVVDMLRLNDVNTGSDVVVQMRHRARVARLACPGSLIDTDNWPMVDRATWRAYLPVQPQLGVPALYFDESVDATGEPLEEADYALLRAIWAERAWVQEPK